MIVMYVIFIQGEKRMKEDEFISLLDGMISLHAKVIQSISECNPGQSAKLLNQLVNKTAEVISAFRNK